MSKRIISLILVFSIIIFSVPFFVSADGELVSSGGALVPAEFFYEVVDWGGLVGAILEVFQRANEFVGDIMDYIDNGGVLEDWAIMCGMYCEAAAESSDDYVYSHTWEGGLSADTVICKYCGISIAEWNAEKAYDDYVSTLPAGLNASSTGVTAYGTGFKIDSSAGNADSKAYWETIDIYSIFNSSNFGYMLTTYYTYYSNAYYTGFRLLDSDVSGVTFVQYFEIASLLPYTSATYPLATLVSGFNTITSSSTIFCRNEYEALVYFLASNEPVYFLTPESYIVQRDTSYYYGGCSLYHMGYIDQNGTVYYDTSINISSGRLKQYVSNRGLLPLDADYSDSYDSTTRVSSLTQSISKYNSGNNWVDNSTTVNYFIGTVGEDGTVSGVYDMSIFDEDTLIFTEPVTGAQYQTSGWTYDYMTRSYDIDVESGTFAIGDSDITRIVCTYGDDFVTIAYYDSSGSVIQTDEYVYVMGSQSACSLSGHSYTAETSKEASCTGTGERVYTCSVCGDQKVEDIPMKQHSSTYSVFKEATCIDSGVALYTCSTCGTQYTETIDALGHDWISVDGTDTSYALPEGTSCPACSGVDYTCELDDASSTYSCTCNSCGTSWTAGAVVTSGYTKYECTRCGVTKTEYDVDDGDGLFQSIGNFFADGLTWCFDKLTQLVEGLAGILDTFNSYVNVVMDQGGEFAGFLGSAVGLLPEDLMAVIWFGVVAFVLVAVILFWLK